MSRKVTGRVTASTACLRTLPGAAGPVEGAATGPMVFRYSVLPAAAVGAGACIVPRPREYQAARDVRRTRPRPSDPEDDSLAAGAKVFMAAYPSFRLQCRVPSAARCPPTARLGQGPDATQRKAKDVIGQMVDRRRVVDVQMVQPLDHGPRMVVGDALRQHAGRAIADQRRIGRRAQQLGDDGLENLIRRAGPPSPRPGPRPASARPFRGPTAAKAARGVRPPTGCGETGE